MIKNKLTIFLAIVILLGAAVLLYLAQKPKIEPTTKFQGSVQEINDNFLVLLGNYITEDTNSAVGERNVFVTVDIPFEAKYEKTTLSGNFGFTKPADALTVPISKTDFLKDIKKDIVVTVKAASDITTLNKFTAAEIKYSIVSQ